MLDLQFKYTPWISLKVFHDYFQDQIARNFRLAANDETLHFAQKTGVLMRNTADGVIVLYDTLRAEALKNYLQNHQITKLSFYLFLSDPNFFTYTNIPQYFNTTSHILYLDNLNTSKDNRLHTQPYISEQEFYTTNSTTLEINCETPPIDFKIQNTFQDEVLNTTLEVPRKYHFDLSSLNEGKYITYEGNQVKDNFILLKNKSLQKPIALFDIMIKDRQKEDAIQHIQELEKIPALNYEVCFDTRHTYWKYFIVPKYEEGLESLFIETGDKNIKFLGPQKVEILNGVKAYLFESDVPLSLREISPYRFQLIKKKDAKGKGVKRILRRLPCPNLGPVKPESRDKKAKVFSEIIVYI